MIYEHAYLWIKAGQEHRFERELLSGRSILAAADGCHSVELFRDVERSGAYLLRIGWESLAHHVERFPISPQAPAFAEVVEKFFAREPELRHFDSTPVETTTDPQA
ncbi:antibiotic biosynthesis monooxygenase family protein [Actinomadura macra]|uniref:antibiotic biosynthesis monooxygenase family protein n=1 Tax=Actinomadura macra TaxID=46164 RepID=UPI00082B5FC8|nr:antibiotic biosynthesis monooxygenase family protein [Actinomadura macra]